MAVPPLGPPLESFSRGAGAWQEILAFSFSTTKSDTLPLATDFPVKKRGNVKSLGPLAFLLGLLVCHCLSLAQCVMGAAARRMSLSHEVGEGGQSFSKHCSAPGNQDLIVVIWELLGVGSSIFPLQGYWSSCPNLDLLSLFPHWVGQSTKKKGDS